MLNINDFSMDFFSLKGKNAIVTGGNSGLDRHLLWPLRRRERIFLRLLLWMTTGRRRS